jgi:hypothetical protein
LTSREQKEARKINRIAAAYNMIPNLIWTALFLLPVTVFCYTLMNPKTIFISLSLSLIPIFLPNSFFDLIQLSRNAEFYKRIGVKHINKFAQHGEIINRYLRKRFPDFKTFTPDKSFIKKQFYQTYFFEKFHFSLFLFFVVITIYAMVKDHFAWALVLSICNLFYNIYPNLLQKYIRLKLGSVLKKLN